MDFDLQQFLAEMRAEMHDGFARVNTIVVQVRADLVDHEKTDLVAMGEMGARLDAIQKFTTGFWWTIRTIIAALVVAGAGFAFAALSK